MEPKHIVTQVVGTIVAVTLARWGWSEFRRDWHEKRRLPLVTGPFMGGRTVLAVLGCLVAVVPLFIAVGKFRLLPGDHVAAGFVAMLAWASVGFVFLLLGVTTRQARYHAKGWITLVGDDGIRIDTNDATATLKLAPGVARLRFITAGEGQYVQLDLDDGRTRAHVWGMVGIRALKLVTKEYVPEAQGLMVATSMAPLCRKLAPYITKA